MAELRAGQGPGSGHSLDSSSVRLNPSSSRTWATTASLGKKKKKNYEGQAPGGPGIPSVPTLLPPVSKPLLFIVLVTHGIVNGIVHHLLLHVHNLCLPLELHHDLLDLGQLQLEVGGG